jgi:uncharacterized membrane protein YqjE
VSEGLLGSVQKLVASLLGLARTRLELLSTELEEELGRLALGLVGAVAALLLAALGLAFAGIAVLLAVAPENRLAAAVAIALLFLAAGALVMLAMRRQQRPRMFESSLAELQRDQDVLKP